MCEAAGGQTAARPLLPGAGVAPAPVRQLERSHSAGIAAVCGVFCHSLLDRRTPVGHPQNAVSSRVRRDAVVGAPKVNTIPLPSIEIVMAAAHTTRRRKIAALSFDPLRFYRGEPLTLLEWCFCVTIAVVTTFVTFTRVWVLIPLAVVSAVVVVWARSSDHLW